MPTAENYNNIGVCKTLMALDLKPLTSEEYHNPNRFLYPLETENKTRLSQETTRSTDSNAETMEVLLNDAQKNLQEAIRLNPNLVKATINLAYVFALKDNPEASIGTIKQLPKPQQETTDAKRILAIAYYQSGNTKKAETIWDELKM